MTPNDVRTVIEDMYGVDLMLNSRQKPFINYIKMYYYFSCKLCESPINLYDIASEIGRTHASVINGRNRIEGEIQVGYKDTLSMVRDIEKHLENYSPVVKFSELDKLKQENAELRIEIEMLKNRLSLNKTYHKKNRDYWRGKYLKNI